MKKPAWLSMPVLNVHALSAEQLKYLSSVYDAVAQETLASLALLVHDAKRHKIDNALSQALGLPSFAPIRELLAREPGLTALDINPRQTQEAIDLDDDEGDLSQRELNL